MTLTQRADQLLRDALGRIPRSEDMRQPRAVLDDQRTKLAAPLRVALAGRVSSGKSTLVNALVGAPVAVTGKGPVTLAVSVLGYADTPSWTVRYADGSVQDIPDLASLAKFTARNADGTATASEVDFVQVLGRYPCLRQFDLVDTPGFDSPHGPDTDEALRAIGASPESVMRASADELRSADAIIAVLQHALSGPDADVLRRFHLAGGEGFSPTAITSMAVLTKVEEYWRGANDPLETAAKHARRIMAHEGTRRLFHRVLPVCSKVAEAAASFPDGDFPALEELAAVENLDQFLRNVRRFAADEYLPLTADRRRNLADLFHPYGIWLACGLIRDGVNDVAELRRGLEERSSLPELRRELTERFAGHSGLIKVARAVEAVRGLPASLPHDVSDRDRHEVARAVEAITGLVNTEPAFAEFDVLRRHYAGELQLDEPVLTELERALGEHGVTVAARLGLPAGTGLEDLEQTALELLRWWSDGSVERGAGGRIVGRVMKRRYEELYDRVRRARAVLADVALFGDESVTAEDAGPAAEPAGRGPVTSSDEPVLVVDLGTTTSSAILLDDERTPTPISEPSVNEYSWPTAVCEKDGQVLVGSAAEAHRLDNPLAFGSEFKPDIGRAVPVMHGAVRSYTAEDLATAVLKALRDEAAGLRENSWAPVSGAPRRLLVTVPAQTDGRRRDAMIRAGQRAGFTDVELLPEPVAAAFSAGDTWPAGSTVLVYDLGGGTFDAALVRLSDQGHRVLGTAGYADGHGGRDVDDAIFRDIEPLAQEWLPAAPGREAERGEVMDITRIAAVTLKKSLTATDAAVTGILPGIRAHLNRTRLAELTEGLLKDTVECCAKLIADAGLSPGDVTGVLLVGGSTRMPVVLPYVRRYLEVGGPVRRAKNPVLAVVEGAASWAENAASRRGFGKPPSLVRVPLSWSLPGGSGTLVRWLVEQHDAYPDEATLARVRLSDNSLYDLRARTAGRVEQQHVWPGGQLYSGSWVVTTLRPAQAGDVLPEPRELRHWPGEATALAVSPEGRRLAIASREASSVLIVDTVTGGQLSRCRVDGRVLCLAWAGGTRPAFGLSSDDGVDHSLSVLDEAPAGAVVSPRELARQATAVLDLAYLPGGREIAVACGKGVLRIADAVTGQAHQVLELSGSPDTLAVTGDGRRIAVGGGDSVQGVVHLVERHVDTGTWAKAQSPRVPSEARALGFGPDRLLLAGGGEDARGYLLAFDLAQGGRSDQRPAHWPTDLGRPPGSARDPGNRAVYDVSFSRDRALFAVAADGLVWVGDAGTGGLLCAITHPGPPTAVALSSDGHWLYTAGPDGVRTWALTETESAGNHDI